MTKRLHATSALVLVFTLGCDGATSDAKSAGKPQAAGDAPANAQPETPTLEIDEASWVETNLGQTASLIPVTVKLPKTAKLTKNGNGGVDIVLADHYMITVSNLAVSTAKEAVEWGEALTINHSSYKNGKKVVDDPAGFVFTHQMNDEANGHTYEPESHFVYALEKEGAVYAFRGERTPDAFMTPGSAYPEELAKKVYGIVKQSAKAN